MARAALLSSSVVTVAALVLAAAPHLYAQGGPPQVRFETLIERSPVHAGTTALIAVRVTLPDGYHVNSNVPLDDFLIPTSWTLEPPAGITAVRIAYPEAHIFLQADVLELLVYETEFVVGAELNLAPDLAPGSYTIGGDFGYQACDDVACYAPTSEPLSFTIEVVDASVAAGIAQHGDVFSGFEFVDVADVADVAVPARVVPRIDPGAVDDVSVLLAMDRFEVAATAGGYMGAEAFLEFLAAAESGQGQKGWFDGRGPLAILALILVGGLALNLTPCVLPMIPINLAIIGAGSQAGSRMRGFVLGGAYGSAMAAVYGVLGLVVILTAGTFGTINSSPWFNFGMAALFVVLALAMFDVLHIDFSRLQSRLTFGSGGRGSLFVAFGMGGVAALLAGACVAPVVIQVIVFSSNLYATGTPSALALPFLLGVGMALPWPIAGAGLSFLPKPGAWMVRVKQVFGVFILGTALYYGWLGYGLVAQRWVDADEVMGSVAELAEKGWHTTLAGALAEAEVDGKLVLVDIWASWCKNCLVMDRTTLRDPDVEAALEDYVKVKFRAEDLNASPAREVMKRLGAVGLPAYGVLRPTVDDAS